MSTAGESGVFGTTSPAYNLYGLKRTASFCLNSNNNLQLTRKYFSDNKSDSQGNKNSKRSRMLPVCMSRLTRTPHQVPEPSPLMPVPRLRGPERT